MTADDAARRAVSGVAGGLSPVGRIGMAEVERLEAATGVFRALDYQYGGGSCRDAVHAQLSWGEQLLRAEGIDAVKARFEVALADLHNLSGWTSFDTGLVSEAYRHLRRALDLAQWGGNDALVANVRYRLGRVFLHHDHPDQALAEFQHGEVAATVCGSALALTIIYANQAWAQATMGHAEEAHTLLGRATDTFGRAEVAAVPGWARFFNATDLSAMVGTVSTELALRVDPTYTRQAIPALTTALVGYGPDMARSRSFNLSALATNHLLDGDIDQATVVGTKAIEASEGLKSARTKDRMRPLKHQANQRVAHPEARELSERITAFFNTRIGCSWTEPTPPTQDCASPCHHAWCPPPAVTAA